MDSLLQHILESGGVQCVAQGPCGHTTCHIRPPWSSGPRHQGGCVQPCSSWGLPPSTPDGCCFRGQGEGGDLAGKKMQRQRGSPSCFTTRKTWSISEDCGWRIGLGRNGGADCAHPCAFLTSLPPSVFFPSFPSPLLLSQSLSLF